ncbi:MAG TPA: diguanylate cyclase response regulator [Cyanothece sp. UBA12306]|nr:diguanylate cyclase response regulator [Cyanothece sp. UBA12306]
MTSETILIVDDQLPNLKVLTTMLKGKNYKVRKTVDGESAIEAVQIEPPDLILLDIKMPDMDGYEVCQRLKSDDKTKDVPIIFISALSEVFDKVKAFEVGGIDYITKPFQEEEVLARINSQLTIKKQQKLLQNDKELLIQKQKKLEKEIKLRKEAQSILYQSRALISSVLTNSLDGIAAFESVRNSKTGKIADFRCLVINPILAELFNQQPEDFSGQLILKNFLEQLDEQLDFSLFALFVEIVETGLSLNKDLSYQCKQGKKWYHLSAIKLADGFSLTVRNITERKKRELELNRRATIDGLTGIYNRRTFDISIAKEWKRAQREKQTLSIILFDVDYFKLYNDCYGHQAGDDCLKQIAQTVKKILNRSVDSIARYGGEEFIIILPNTDQQGAITVVENIQHAIYTLAIPHKQSKVSQLVSISLGIASIIPISASSPANLINLADKALYRAKQQGRNRYSVAEI